MGELVDMVQCGKMTGVYASSIGVNGAHGGVMSRDVGQDLVASHGHIALDGIPVRAGRRVGSVGGTGRRRVAIEKVVLGGNRSASGRSSKSKRRQSQSDESDHGQSDATERGAGQSGRCTADARGSHPHVLRCIVHFALLLRVHVGVYALDISFATWTLDPSPRHRVLAPTFWLASDGISVRTLAMKLASVSGVRSLRRGSCCGFSVRRSPSRAAYTYPFYPIVRCLPAARLSYNDGRARSKRVEYPRVVYPKEDIVHTQHKPRQNKDARRHHALQTR